MVIWKATLQPIFTLSSIETKYVVATKAVKEAIWLKELMPELVLVQRIMAIHSDSQSVIHLCKNQVFHKQSEHIDV